MARDQAGREAGVGDGFREVAPRTRVVEHVSVRVFRLPTARIPETDGTAAWSATTMVLVEVRAAGELGLGYSYVDAAAAEIVRDLLADCLVGADAFAIAPAHARMVRAVRNHGRAGVCACAISAVDIALWDLKAKLLELPLAELLGPAQAAVPVYASGGFTSTPLDELAREIQDYVAAGHTRVKIKIGRDLELDLARVALAHEAAGAGVELMVDANGAYTRKQALAQAERFREQGVVYFEEPVSSDDLEGLRLLRDRSSIAIAAGEYGYDAMYFRHMLDAGAVDILQADATRCLGITGFLQAAALCEAFGTPLSAHCAPALHAHAGAASSRLVHVEHFFDHVRMEELLFEGTPRLQDGALLHDPRRPGLGRELRVHEARRHAA